MNEKQREVLETYCKMANKEFSEEHYHPALGCGDGWVEGWVGGHEAKFIYVGISPEGNMHS